MGFKYFAKLNKMLVLLAFVIFLSLSYAQTCSGGLSGSGLQDCTGSNESPCHTCDVNDFQYEIRAPDDVTTTGWRALTYSSQVGTCSTSCVQENWTASYTWCPQEGSYDIRVRASAQSGSGYGWETSDWSLNIYSVDYDYNQFWCSCKGGTWVNNATYCGSLGCRGGKCCGDDGANDNFCIAGNGSCVAGVYYANHCSDNVQNCDEQGKDCGGADCVSCVETIVNAPNGNQYIKGTYSIDFNVYDPSNHELHAKIAYSSSAGTFANIIVADLNLNNDPNIPALSCEDTDWRNQTRCLYSWNTTSAIDGNYYIDINVWTVSGGFDIDSSDASFRIDNTAPTTTDNASSTWTKNDVNVTLTCSDGSGSGCSATYYCIDTTGTCTPTTSGTLATVTCTSGQVCQKYVRYYSVDAVGNTESTKTSAVIRIDKKAPTYVGYGNIQGYSYQESSSIYWVKGNDDFNIDITHSDDGSGVYEQYFGFNKDDCTPNGCGGAPYEIKSHSIYGQSVIDWMVDDNYIDIDQVTCVDSDGSCSDNDMTLRWHAKIKTTCQDWNYKLHTYLYDQVSNGVGYTDLGVWVKVDNTAPSTSDNATSAWQGSNVDVTLTCTDSRSGCQTTYYCIDDTNTCTPTTAGNVATVTCPTGQICQKYVRYYSVDKVGNSESVKVSAVVRIDKQAPTTSDNAPNTWQTSNFSVTLSCNDGSGIGCSATYYRVDGGSWQLGNSISITTDGNHKIDYYSVDSLNNTEAAKTTYAALDKTPPTLTLTSPSENALISSSAVLIQFTANRGAGSPIDLASTDVLIDGNSSTDFNRTVHCTESDGSYSCSFYAYLYVSGDHNLSVITFDSVGFMAQIDRNFGVYSEYNLEGFTIEPSVPAQGTAYSVSDVGLTNVGGSTSSTNYDAQIGFPPIFRNLPPNLLYNSIESGYVRGTFPIEFYVSDYEFEELHTRLAYSLSSGAFQNDINSDLNLNDYEKISELDCNSADWRLPRLCTYYWDTSNVADNNYYIDLNLWDIHRDTNIYSTKKTICIDNNAPGISISSPLQNSTTSSPDFSFTLTNNGCAALVLSNVQVKLNGSATNFNYATDCNLQGEHYNCSFSQLELQDGDYNLSIIASDLAGNVRQVDRNFHFTPSVGVNDIRPSGTLESGIITISFNVHNTMLNNLYASIYYSSINAGKLGFENVIAADLNLNADRNIANLSCDSNVWWPAVRCTYIWDTSAVADGNYYIDINIWNASGLQGAGSSLKQFLLDNTAPIASITAVSETPVYEDIVYLNCADSGSGCKATRWYYFSPVQNCSSNKADYNYSTTRNNIAINDDHNDYICLWVENMVGLHATAVSEQLHVQRESWGVTKGASETISKWLSDANNTCSFYVTADINLACTYQSFVKIREHPTDINKVYGIPPTFIESAEKPITVVLESAITSFYDERYFLVFESDKRRITSQGNEQDYPNIILRKRTIPLLRADGQLELGTLIIKVRKR